MLAACLAVEGAIARALKTVELTTSSRFMIDATRGGEGDGRQNCNPELLSLPAAMNLLAKWRDNKWRTCRMVPVAHREDLERLDLLRQQVEPCGEMQTNGWKTRRKAPVANREDLERLDLLRQQV